MDESNGKYLQKYLSCFSPTFLSNFIKSKYSSFKIAALFVGKGRELFFKCVLNSSLLKPYLLPLDRVAGYVLKETLT